MSFFNYYRSPKTRQERRANEGKNDPLIRAKRRANNLPTNYDDIRVHHDLCWKSLRKTKYRINHKGYQWRIYTGKNYQLISQLYRRLENLGCYYDYIRSGIVWYGPEIFWDKDEE